MAKESALEALGGRRAGHPTGFRRLTPGLLAADHTAGRFDGLPEGVTVPGQLLAALKAAAPRLGLSLRLVHAVDWLFRFTQAQDWERGGRPIVWPSASMQQDAFNLSPTRVKALNRALIEAGLVTMKDSPNGKRYGKRDVKGRIVEAYGFDLSPLATRHAEFVHIVTEARAERAEMGRLRRRASIARNGIAQILETAAEYGFSSKEWMDLARDSRNLTASLRKLERLEEMAIVVESLERRQREACERLETLLAAIAAEASGSVHSDPLGPENGPHQYTYKSAFNPEQDTVTAFEPGKSRMQATGPERRTGGPAQPRSDQARGAGAGQGREKLVQKGAGAVLQVATDEVTFLAPRLRTYLKSSTPDWQDIVEAADWLRGELGVSQSLWGEACVMMGREQAAVAIAIVSAKPPGHFRSTPGGYFHGMVAKAKTGELNLARTIWGLRKATSPKSCSISQQMVSRSGASR